MTTVERSRPDSEVATSGHPDQGETLPLYLCPACGVEARERDRFCRRCGANQSGHIAPLPTAQTQLLAPASADQSASPSATSSLPEADPYRPVSGSLTKALAAGVSAGTLSRCASPAAQKMIRALISIPIWLIIILLSPMDAYATAKAVTRQS